MLDLLKLLCGLAYNSILSFIPYCTGDTPKLQEVFKELLDLATLWKTIGTLLGLESQLLERIKSDEEGAHDRLQKMLSEWLKQADPPPTWKDITDAVERVDATKAQEIRKHFIDTILHT